MGNEVVTDRNSSGYSLNSTSSQHSDNTSNFVWWSSIISPYIPQASAAASSCALATKEKQLMSQQMVTTQGKI
jgi:hypothetical protein